MDASMVIAYGCSPSSGSSSRMTDGRISFWLLQQSRQRDEAQRSVRERGYIEVSVSADVLPFEADRVFVQRKRLKNEVVEERRDEAHGVPQESVRIFVLFAQKIQKRREVRAVCAQIAVVVQVGGLLYWSGAACVVEVVEPPT